MQTLHNDEFKIGACCIYIFLCVCVCFRNAFIVCSPYATDQFPIYAEPIPACKRDLDPKIHISSSALSEAAARHGIFLIGGM